MNGIDDISRELRRELKRKQENYTCMMKWIKDEVVEINRGYEDESIRYNSLYTACI